MYDVKIYEDKLKEKLELLPENLTVKDIAAFLGISRTTAYNIANSVGFPRLKTPGRRLVIIPKVGFINWYFENCVNAERII